MDQIVLEARVAKATIYRHFGSKEQLIVAVLQHFDKAFQDALNSHVVKSAHSPMDRIKQTFEYLEQWYGSSGFNGCPFQRAAAEYPDQESIVFQEVRKHHATMRNYFLELLVSANLPDAERLAEEFSLLYEGATTLAQVNGDPEIARTAKTAAFRLIEGKN